MSGKAFENYAWILLLFAASLFALAGLVHLVSGRPVAAGLGFVRGNLGMTWVDLVAESPEVANAISGFVRMMTVFVLGLFVLFVSMVVTSYRRGEKWAWYAAWVYPAILLGYFSVAAQHHGWASDEWVWVAPGLGFVMVLVLLGFFLPFRRFFPKHGPT